MCGELAYIPSVHFDDFFERILGSFETHALFFEIWWPKVLHSRLLFFLVILDQNNCVISVDWGRQCAGRKVGQRLATLPRRLRAL